MVGVAPTDTPAARPARQRANIAFLAAQLGAYAAERVGERPAALGFTRPQGGLLSPIRRHPGPARRPAPPDQARPRAEPAGGCPAPRHPAQPAGRARG